jgi:hypothetical protein
VASFSSRHLTLLELVPAPAQMAAGGELEEAER